MAETQSIWHLIRFLIYSCASIRECMKDFASMGIGRCVFCGKRMSEWENDTKIVYCKRRENCHLQAKTGEEEWIKFLNFIFIRIGTHPRTLSVDFNFTLVFRILFRDSLQVLYEALWGNIQIDRKVLFFSSKTQLWKLFSF